MSPVEKDGGRFRAVEMPTTLATLVTHAGGPRLRRLALAPFSPAGGPARTVDSAVIADYGRGAMNHLPPTVRRESRDGAVKGLQNALLARGFNAGDIDGVFGPTTEGAVREFQRARGLADDGIAGPNTWQALCVHLVQSGDTLSGIAELRLGDASRFSEIFELNRELVADPDRIFPEQVLTLPEDAC